MSFVVLVKDLRRFAVHSNNFQSHTIYVQTSNLQSVMGLFCFKKLSSDPNKMLSPNLVHRTAMLSVERAKNNVWEGHLAKYKFRTRFYCIIKRMRQCLVIA